nr:hypothetical protein [Tanacetum cinerariifolium]
AMWFGEAEESFLHNVSEDKETVETATGVVVGLRIPKEEWRGKDTSFAQFKAMAQTKCDTAFEIRRVTRLSEAEILLLAQVGTQIRVRGPKIVGASRTVEDQMKNTLKTKHLTRMKAPRLHRYEDPPEIPV